MNRYEEYGDYDEEELPSLESDDDEDEGEQPDEPAVAPVPLGLSLRYGLGTFLTAGVLDLVAHFGPTGLVVGGIAAYAASQHGPQLVGYLTEALPAGRLAPPAVAPRRRGKSRSQPRSVLDRALGRFPDEDRQQDDTLPDDEDTLLVQDEEDEEEQDVWLPDSLTLGSLRPHADSILSHRLVLLGMPGAGKSNLIAVLVEELGQYDAPLIVFDHKPEYAPLCQQPYLRHPVRLSARTLSPQNAAATAQRLMQERWQAVLDLSSYGSDAEAAGVMTELIAGVLRYQKARENAARLPCTFVLDEAHYWLPEHEGHSTLRGLKLRSGQALLSYVQQAFFTLAKLGRSFGMGLVVATQRPADVDKRLISSADWRFLLKALEPADLKVYRAYGLSDEQAMSLNPRQGQAYVIGPDGLHGVCHIRRRESPDVAKSPGLDNIRQAGARERSPFPQAPAFERGNTPAGTFPGNTRAGESWPVERTETFPTRWEQSPVAGNAGNTLHEETGMGSEAEGYTHEEEAQVLLAYAELLRTGNGVIPSRRAIKDALGWSSRQFSRVIKPVCDKHAIAVREN